MPRELLVVGGIFVLLGLATVAVATPPPLLIGIGQRIMLGAMAFGVPLELLYFVLLGVVARDRLPAGWYWQSFEHHHVLEPRERWLVIPPFVSGALAMLAGSLGILVTIAGIGMMLLQL